MSKVLSFTSNPKKFTVYLDNGEQKTFRTDDPKTQLIVKEVIEAKRANRVVNFDVHEDTFKIYRQVETKTNGLVKFYRMAKSLFGGESKPEVTLELIATHSLPDVEPYNEETQTVVAVVEPEGKGTKIAQTESPAIVAGAEILKRQVAHAATDKGNTEALANFLRRFATVAKERQHSAEDLLAFFEKHDMPITVNGDIVAYKRLNKKRDSYVDAYTGRVTQWVGSYVHMNADMVNPDRSTECSNGLHVARRSYLSQFRSDTIIVVLIAPEDVIAVPRGYNRAKMRCMGYHIVLEVSKEGFQHLVADSSVTQNHRESMILKDIIEGKHVPIMSRVHIGGHRGMNLTITGSCRHHHHAEPDQTVDGVKSLEDHNRSSEEIRKENSPANIRAAMEAPQEAPETPKAEPVNDKAGVDPLVDNEELKDVADFHDQVVANGGTNEGMGGPIKTTKPKAKATKPKAKAKPKTKAKAKAKPTKAKSKAPAKPIGFTKAASLDEMTDDQKLAKAHWAEVRAGTMSKSELAKACNTSPRSLVRWAEKFNF